MYEGYEDTYLKSSDVVLPLSLQLLLRLQAVHPLLF